MAKAVPRDDTIPYETLTADLRAEPDGPALYRAIVNAPFDHTVETAFLFLSFIVCFLVDESTGELYLAAASDTEGYKLSIQGYDFDPASYRIPLGDPKSTLVRALSNGRPQTTTDWNSLSRPQASEDTVRLNQATSGITYSVVHPFSDDVRGALMYNYAQYQGAIGPEQHDFMTAYTEIVSQELTKRHK